jgi:hypothetical protein
MIILILRWGYSGGPHIRFLFGGEGSLWILGFGVPSRPNASSGPLKSTLPGPREGSSILNIDLVIVTAAVTVAEPTELIGFGAVDVPQTICKWFGDIHGSKPYEFPMVSATIDPMLRKPYKFIGFGAMDVTKPYKFIGFRGHPWPQTLQIYRVWWHPWPHCVRLTFRR